jgi:hypothetical protein
MLSPYDALKEAVNGAKAPTAVDQVSQCLSVTFACVIWRGVWDLWDWYFGTGFGSALGSAVIGGGIIVASRNIGFLRSSLPVNDGQSLRDKACRQLFHCVIISAVALYWRGVWEILDNAVPWIFPHGEEWLDPMITLLAGCTLMSVLNFSFLGKHGVVDDIAMEGG